MEKYPVGKRDEDELNAFYNMIALFYPNEWDTPKLDKDMTSGIASYVERNKDK